MAFLIHTAYYSAAGGKKMEGWELRKIKSMFRVNHADKTVIREKLVKILFLDINVESILA